MSDQTKVRSRPDRRDRPLTTRHRQVLGLIAEGCSEREIAVRLGVSPSTVGVHTDRLYLRLGVRSRADAIRAGVLRGELPGATGIPTAWGPVGERGAGDRTAGHPVDAPIFVSLVTTEDVLQRAPEKERVR